MFSFPSQNPIFNTENWKGNKFLFPTTKNWNGNTFRLQKSNITKKTPEGIHGNINMITSWFWRHKHLSMVLGRETEGSSQNGLNN